MASPFVWYLAWRVMTVLWVRFRPDANRDSRPAGARFSRRKLLCGVAAGATAAVPGGLGVYATFVEPGRARVRRYTAPIQDLPAALAGSRLQAVFLADT